MSAKPAYLMALKIRLKSSFYDMIDRLAYMKPGNTYQCFFGAG
ncbi:hypothetical protein [Paenibacillus lactis]